MDMKRIEQWSVIGTGCVVGEVYNRPDHQDGGQIVTSPVVEVRMLGGSDWDSAYPVVFTESGSAYRLGRPAPSYSMADARSFICEKLNAGDEENVPARVRARRSESSTIVRAVLDTSLQHIEKIELDATSFQPL